MSNYGTIQAREKTNDPEDNNMRMVENGNKGSTFCKSKTYNPLFAHELQEKLRCDFMKKHDFAPGIEQTRGLKLTRALDIVESYNIQHVYIAKKIN